MQLCHSWSAQQAGLLRCELRDAKTGEDMSQERALQLLRSLLEGVELTERQLAKVTNTCMPC